MVGLGAPGISQGFSAQMFGQGTWSWVQSLHPEVRHSHLPHSSVLHRGPRLNVATPGEFHSARLVYLDQKKSAQLGVSKKKNMKHVIFMMIYKCLLGKMTIIFVKPECLQGIFGGVEFSYCTTLLGGVKSTSVVTFFDGFRHPYCKWCTSETGASE